MIFPALTLEWQETPNHPVPHRSTGADQARELFYQLTAVLLGFDLNPPTVVGSSNGTTAALDGVNRITSSASVVGNGAGAHSWIVLEWASGLQACWDFNHGDVWLVSLVFSAAAGFTGGSTTARPTAADEAVNMTNQHLAWGNATGDMRIHAVHSTNGHNTYLFVTGQGSVRTVFLVGRAVDPPTDWTDPTFGIMRGSADTTLIWAVTYGETDRISARHPTGAMPLRMSFASMYNVAIPGAWYQSNTMAFVPSSWTREYPVTEIGLVSMGGGLVAPRGRVADLWRTGEGVAPGRVFREAGYGHALANFAGFLIPWPLDVEVEVF